MIALSEVRRTRTCWVPHGLTTRACLPCRLRRPTYLISPPSRSEETRKPSLASSVNLPTKPPNVGAAGNTRILSL